VGTNRQLRLELGVAQHHLNIALLTARLLNSCISVSEEGNLHHASHVRLIRWHRVSRSCCTSSLYLIFCVPDVRDLEFVGLGGVHGAGDLDPLHVTSQQLFPPGPLLNAPTRWHQHEQLYLQRKRSKYSVKG